MALHGDPVTVRGALQRLEHRDGHVRAAALRTLSWVARVGDVEVMAKVGLPVMKIGDAHGSFPWDRMVMVFGWEKMVEI